MIFEIISGGEKLTGWGKNGPAYFFPGERMGRPILSPGKKLTGGKFRPVTPVIVVLCTYEPRSDRRDLLAIKFKNEIFTEKERPSCCEQLQEIWRDYLYK